MPLNIDDIGGIPETPTQLGRAVGQVGGITGAIVSLFITSAVVGVSENLLYYSIGLVFAYMLAQLVTDAVGRGQGGTAEPRRRRPGPQGRVRSVTGNGAVARGPSVRRRDDARRG